ncbi:MAG: CRISPR system precrRNA processing endoribonuclease RAMP protein Cas6 [Desulfuromonadales bacterium]|nr:CRISPR system precrRNA processing endoribonuclease RAMP protein Cas6 [Desulfuromonadales bacterium]NIS40057.1 CRISPR system precrRNA processing endoribonuclease RAMP protein Cas6 [Desulfuromonadales bacterium]
MHEDDCDMMDGAPQSLRHLEFSCVHFELEFQQEARLPAGAFLQLRRELLDVARLAEGSQDGGCRALFEPPLPTDPVVRKRIQKPGPGFVIRGIPLTERVFEVGDSFELTVYFWGRAVRQLADFARLLEMLGRSGMSHGRAAFEIACIEAEDASGQRHLLHDATAVRGEPAPPLLDAGWFIDSVELAPEPTLEMRFVTPARLLSRGKPIFKPSFRAIFPFLLRRVTSMAQAHCDLELIREPGDLIAAASHVEATRNTLHWADWRRLEGEHSSQDLGGVVGSLRLEGRYLRQIAWVLRLGSLLQVGKGAAYGAGRYTLHMIP